jgi:hypothetical protein
MHLAVSVDRVVMEMKGPRKGGGGYLLEQLAGSFDTDGERQ